MKIQCVRMLSLTAGLFLGNAAFAQVSLGGAAPTITLTGSGCARNQGSEAHWESGSLVVNFGGMEAAKGPGLPLSLSRKACSITLDLHVPEGLSYALAAYSAQGYDDLSGQDTRTLSLTQFFQGEATAGSSKELASGPLAASFDVNTYSRYLEPVWSPCGLQRAHTLTAALRVGGSDRQAASASTLESLRLTFRVKPC